MKIKFLVTLFSITIWFGSAQDKAMSLSLQDAINYALENNRTAKNAARDIEAAKAQKWETIATGLPQINGTIDYQYNIKRQFDDPVDFNMDNIPEFGAKQSASATATLTQLVFDGSYLVGLQSAKVFLEISENAKIKTDLDIRKEVISTYGNVLLANENVKILEKNIQVLSKNLSDTKKLFEEGFVEEENVEQLQITLSNLQNNLDNANRLKSITHQMLNIVLSNPIHTKLILTNTLDNLAFQEASSLALLNQALDLNTHIDYKIAKNNHRSKELLLKLERYRRLPSINAFLNGAYLTNSEDFVFFNSNQKWIPTSVLGVSIKIPMFSSGRSNALVKRAKINLEKANDDLLDIESQLSLQAQTAKSNHEFALKNYSNRKENLKLAERIEKKNQIKFFEGITSSFDLRQAQTQLYTAQQEYLQAMLNVITTRAELETALNITTK